ncbi:ATP-dependent DNA helicase RecQ [Oculatella sp. FACHB-28]|uniref:RecQ family ATP-dependent DNA helicase n=1 Tax=Oculatella sp. FACHB-28 TaxID=2692845 RepID=UPI00168795EC|nr:ATP-dependent DNA helicase RecQ [Oculatella sp. FACHB-28]MBD2059939.1 ATP-dependent DNA helicase RecQ [Oculatella sp. FACHB-28]
MHLSEQTAWNRVRATFQKVWGYQDFRPPQGEIVHTLLAHQDALVVMPTGGGKSICFQLPALMRTGVTLVVSPLVALMENQVQDLQQRQLSAALLHSELPTHQRRQTLWALERQKLRLLYLSPETLLSEAVWERLCQPNLKINGLILDEAHCLVQWGDTFRPAYRRLGTVRSALLQSKPAGTQIGIAAFTATADPQAQQIIQQVLQLQHPQIFRLNPYRSNLHLAVQIAWTPKGRRQSLLKFVQARSPQAGLVYVRTRQDSESLADWLAEKGYKTAAYHAGLSPEERRAIESAWLKDEIRFVVCTSAFGMGINKPDVRWVVHFHAPALLSEYVQEVGRAGRDGLPAETLTLVSEPTGWLDPEDRQRQRFFQDRVRSLQKKAQQLAQQLPVEGDVKEVSRQFKDGAIALAMLHSSGQLEWQDPFRYRIHASPARQTCDQANAAQQMQQYLTTSECRWKFLLQAFGFGTEANILRCGHCDRCPPT